MSDRPLSGQLLSVSDDDICSDCRHCNYRPGELSYCNQGWPGLIDDNLYVVECDHFEGKP